ncbi:MAG: dapC [Acidimicrobiia bacterium]|nr:dapC [Acidimicrobiia bacterium]
MAPRPYLNPRMAEFGTTIFAEMSELATRTGSINLGQGFPDFDGPTEVIDAAVDALRAGHNQYPPGPGIAALREAVSAHQQRFYGLVYEPDTEVLITVGATEAIAAAVLALVQTGDEVVAFEPYYDSYAATIALAGGQRVPVTLRAPDFAVDLDRLRAAITARTRLLLVNCPHNPTGTVFSLEELNAIAELAVERDLIVIADEVYEHLSYDRPHVPLASLPGMRERTISIGSAGKTFSFTGWKVGWACAPPELLSAVRSVKQFLTYVGSGPFQYAIADALGLPDDYFSTFTKSMSAKRDLLTSGLTEAGFTVYPSKGTYFVVADARPLGFDDGYDLCRRMPELAGVVAVPCSVFYDDQSAGRSLVRFAFCKRDEVLIEACQRLATLAPR